MASRYSHFPNYKTLFLVCVCVCCMVLQLEKLSTLRVAEMSLRVSSDALPSLPCFLKTFILKNRVTWYFQGQLATTDRKSVV